MLNQQEIVERERYTTLHFTAGRRLAEQLLWIKSSWPQFYNDIDPARVSDAYCYFITELITRAVDFDSTTEGGRGELYRHAQHDPLIRAVGIRQLFELVSPGGDLSSYTPHHKVLDVLGGDGVLTRALHLLTPPESMPNVITSDLSEDMVAAAQAYGLFAMWQPAQNLLLKDNSLDGVIIAYGSHHIPKGQRLKTCQEAFRVLRPGGKIAFHDFEEDSPMSRWFGDVVDRYSQTGHAFPHFTREEIAEYLSEAGFEDVTVRHLYDPFVMWGESPDDVRRALAECLLYMYGLVKLSDGRDNGEALMAVDELAFDCFKYDYGRMGLDESFGAPAVRLEESGGRWRIELPRVALVGCGVKPDGKR